ncbi:F-box-like protein [Ceratobasidium sp. AG-Ba]|nr:F-box-like protein [Ceratobasidium sp. AG-Ba]
MSDSESARLPNKGANVHAALEAWEEGCALLFDAIKAYQASCDTFRAACMASLGQPDGFANLEETLLAINSRLGCLETYEDTLRNERMLLAAMRNTSGTLVRINSLPPEVLAKVFKPSKTCYIGHKSVRLYELSHVCTRWRRIVLNTPDLWTHIDIGPRVPNARSRLFLENSRNNPICVHLSEGLESYKESKLQDNVIHEVVQTLMPHIQRVHTLDIQSQVDQRLPMAVAQIWLEFGDPRLPKALSIFLPDGNGTSTVIDGSDKTGIRLEHPENTHQILCTIRKLHVQAARFSWNSPAYRDLTDLRAYGETFVFNLKAPELFNILASSPNLETLRLESIVVSRPKGWTVPLPIAFNRLRTLMVHRYPLDSLVVLLSMITLVSECTVSVGTYNPDDSEIVAFFSRSRITTLCQSFFYGNDGILSLGSHLDVLPHLRTIVLRDVDASRVIGRLPVVHGASHPLDIILVCSSVSMEALKHIIPALKARSVRLERCHIWGGWPISNLERSLVELYPQIKFSSSDNDSTDYLPCHSMLD